ncbi:IMP dehydrogenase/GMP reductase related, partial [Trifolium pratense]
MMKIKLWILSHVKMKTCRRLNMNQRRSKQLTMSRRSMIYRISTVHFRVSQIQTFFQGPSDKSVLTEYGGHIPGCMCHRETSNFDIPSGEITVTLHDMYCMFYFPIEATLLDHHNIISKAEGIYLMVRYIGSSAAAADGEVTQTRGAHARFTYLKRLLCTTLELHFRLSEMARIYHHFKGIGGEENV